MAASTTEIANLALRQIGHARTISNLDTEQSEEARAVRALYSQELDQALRDANWPFATAFVALALVEEDPTEEWAFAYRLPADSLRARRILSGSRNDSRQTRVPYRLVHDPAGALIYTDKDGAVLEYTVRVTDPLRFPPDFTHALALRLAVYLSPQFAADDPRMGQRAAQLYAAEIAMARASAENEIQPDEEPPSEMERAREGGAFDLWPWRWIWPVR